ncbi:MAG: 5-oxoprolinase subunit PxpA [Chromatocurvus sp.]
MLLNCDLGESFGSWRMGMDAEVMPHIDLANVACGFHAGDPVTMNHTIALAREHDVRIGAHPAYPDLVGFGRRSMNLSAEELRASLLYQIAALDGMAASAGLSIDYVKPHGALYNDMMADATVRDTVMATVASYHRPLKLMLLATAAQADHREAASRHTLDLLFEAFADRCYDDNGQLLSRRRPGAVHGRARMLEQVAGLLQDGCVKTDSGRELSLQADTLCVHGDNPEGIAAIREIRALVDRRLRAC